ncbi:zinc knuckle CX2CX4HX4C containing protein [Tanacetum coccineum]|uniref:Zinc knuckle CX2CX4HX4C containing protein n=1 Tax=Tanacetum coccineum TaxID=301880 RepID=A0ABQ5A6D7_9ASTR
MMTTKGMFFFKFNSKDGMNVMIENGSWLIRSVPLILKKWTPGANIIKEDVCNISIWVKFHDIHITAFTEDGLSAIATKLDTPLMLDSYTSTMCTESLGRSSYARAIVELRADTELKDTLVVVIPKFMGEGYTISIIRVEYKISSGPFGSQYFKGKQLERVGMM